MEFMIWTQFMDIHGIAVSKVLESWGHKTVRLFSADIPTMSSYTISFNGGSGEDVITRHKILSNTSLSPNLVWLRRVQAPVVDDEMARIDFPIIRSESRDFLDNIIHYIGSRAVWINPYLSHLRADSKAVQLSVASQAGLHIPATVFTNDPAEIRSFIREHSATGVAYKAFRQDRWSDTEGKIKARLLTSLVSEDDLPSDDTLRLTPGIFQAYVRKNYEVRATFMDEVDISVKILSQANDMGRTDWRGIPISQMQIDQIELPTFVKNACRSIMADLGLRFGAFDFIIDEHGQWVFLEVNEMGQFLWKEVINPRLHILDVFCQFLEAAASGDKFRVYEDRCVSYREIFAKYNLEIELEREGTTHRHQPPRQMRF